MTTNANTLTTPYYLPVNKLIILNLLTLGLYSIFWWYKSFEYTITRSVEQKNAQKKATPSPLQRLQILIMAILSPLFCYWAFSHVAKNAAKTKIRSHWDPLILTIVYQTSTAIFLLYCFEIILHDACILFGLGSFIILIPVQVTCNIMHSARAIGK